MRKRRSVVPPLLLLTCLSADAAARPVAPSTFCKVYPTAPACGAGVASCQMCHATTPPELNVFGASLRPRLSGDFNRTLPAALASVEAADSDGDGVSNVDELAQGTWPGDDKSLDPPRGRAMSWDPRFAFKRALAAVCGRSPSYEDTQAFEAAPDKRGFIHARVDACLAQSYWQHELVPHLADKRIQPLGLMGTCFNQFFDFEKDYDLFTYALTGGRDARLLLTAQYFVERLDDGSFRKIDESKGPAAGPPMRAGVRCSPPFGGTVAAAQNAAPPYRAGMWTTQNFIVGQTVAAYLPRVTAAQAIRHWLGTEPAQYEGLYPVEGEPRDLDFKGVAARPCTFCHSTIDPLAYAFAYYIGTPFGREKGFAAYDRGRATAVDFPGISLETRQAWAYDPPSPRLFGETFASEDQAGDSASLVAIARRAADSPQFARNLTLMMFQALVGTEPEPRDLADVASLAARLKADGHSIDRLVHHIVDSNAFGAP